MRKYWKLLLTLSAVISAGFFLFYKHQYDRLREVLQVLNTFGSPGGATVAPPVGDLLWSADTWQQVTPDLYIFSSYLVHGVGVVTLAAGRSAAAPSADRLSCWVWLEGLGSVSGRVSVLPLPAADRASSLAAWRLLCVADTERAPYAVGYRGSAGGAGREPVVSAVGRQEAAGPAGQLGLCVEPAAGEFAAADTDRLAEFAAFHQAVGVTGLWVYEPVVSAGVAGLLLGAVGSLPARIVRWNFPYRLSSAADVSMARDLLHRDCAARAAGHVQHVLALNTSQYVVPRRHDTLQMMIQATEEQMNRHGAPAFTLSQEVFCTDSPDGPYGHKPPLLTFSRKTSVLASRTRSAAVRLYRPEAVPDPFSSDGWSALGRSPLLNPLVAAVHLYTDCGHQPVNATLFEGVAVRFKSRTVNSPVYVNYLQQRDAALMRPPPSAA